MATQAADWLETVVSYGRCTTPGVQQHRKKTLSKHPWSSVRQRLNPLRNLLLGCWLWWQKICVARLDFRRANSFMLTALRIYAGHKQLTEWMHVDTYSLRRWALEGWWTVHSPVMEGLTAVDTVISALRVGEPAVGATWAMSDLKAGTYITVTAQIKIALNA